MQWLIFRHLFHTESPLTRNCVAYEQRYNSLTLVLFTKVKKLEEKNNAPAFQRELRRFFHAA
jgi:hypothetical protein